jgi:predicted ribosome quality control (RQC) complex YloA/Tae2 family protein
VGLSSAELRAVLTELQPALTGGWLQKISQPLPAVILLDIRAPGQTHVLLLSADPQTARLHLTTRKLPNPPSPPPFCQLLRARLQGARIDRIEQVGEDRIARLGLTARDGACALIAQLTGRSADLLLLNEAQIVLGALRGGTNQARRPYQVPESGAPRAHENEESISLYPDVPFPVSAALEARYTDQELARAQEQATQVRLGQLSKSIKKTKKRIDALRADLEKAEKFREYGRYGELLKANLGRVQKGHTTITVVDYYDPTMPELALPLDPAKSPQANLAEYFTKHRRFQSAEDTIRPRLAAAEQGLRTMQEERLAIQRGDIEPASCSPPARLGGSGAAGLASPSSKKGRRQQKSGPFRRFTSADGLPIYVGRNARENDELTFKLAKSDDLWLHAHGTPGCHVVVRLERGAEVPPETLRDAATLALLYSDLKKSGKGEVIYTRRKHVRKTKGQAPGAVTVTQEKSVHVSLDRTRLARLKDKATEPDSPA